VWSPRRSALKNLHETVLDLMSPLDQKATSRRLVEKLASFSSGDVDLLELGQTPLRLQQADGTRHQFRLHPQWMELDRETGRLT